MTRDESLERLALPRAITDRWQAQLAEPHRHYHTQAHIDAMLDAIDAGSPPTDQWRERLAIIWLHDIVYDPTRADNEERSADQAGIDLAGSGIDVAVVREVILATKRHDPTTAIGRHICDLDLTILGADPAGYDRYAARIRREYAHVAEEAWRAGRPAVLRGFLARSAIFHLPHFASLEAQAHANLSREIAALKA